MGKELTPTILDAQIAPRAPVSTDLMTRVRNSLLLAIAIVESNGSELLEGVVDSVTSGTIVDVDPTSGAIFQDDQFNDYYLHFKTGAAFTANNSNRFKIIATSLAANSISVAESLAAIGVATSDEYVILGHTHDGDDTNPDGAAIDLKTIKNILFDQVFGQDLADALTDPLNLRAANVNKNNPFTAGTGVSIFTFTGRIFDSDGVAFSHKIFHNLGQIPEFIKIRGVTEPNNNTFNVSSGFHAEYDVIADVMYLEGNQFQETADGLPKTPYRSVDDDDRTFTMDDGSLYATKVISPWSQSNFTAFDDAAIIVIADVTDTYVELRVRNDAQLVSNGNGHHDVVFYMEFF